MFENKFKQSVTPETEEQIMQNIADSKEALPFLVDLTPVDRRRLAKFSRKRQDFIDKVMIHADQNPGLVPQFADMADYRSDVLLIASLQRIYAAMNLLREQVRDTIMAAQAEAYETARSFYSVARVAARHGVDGTEQVIDDLSYHFRRRGGASADEDSAGKEDGQTDTVPSK